MMTDGSAAGACRGYVCPARDQLFLMPVCMRDWLAEGHLVWFVLDVVAELDTSALHRRPGGSLGRRPYEPEMMCALLLYAYCCGVRSSRRIEAACETDAAFRVICGGLVPDHATVARFVVDHEQALEGLFVEGVRVCAAAGLVDLAVVALDGTKVAGDASLDRNRDADWIRREIAGLLAATAQTSPPPGAASASPPLDGMQPPAEGVAGPGGRLGRLQAALAVIEAEDAEEAAARAAAVCRQTEAAAVGAQHGRRRAGAKPVKDLAVAVARAEADLIAAQQHAALRAAARQAKVTEVARAGRTMRGPEPGPDRRLVQADARLQRVRAAVAHAPAPPERPARRVNVTDPDSRVMKTPGGWLQGYNAHAIANQHQIVLAVQVSQDPFDVHLYQPMTTALARTLTAAGIPDQPQLVLADAGYWSHDNATTPGPDRLIATLKDHKQRRAARELGHTHGPPPPDATPAQEMEHLLRTPQGAAAYAQRSCLIEPIFGDRKHNRHLRRFRRRGLSAVRSEWAFIHLAANLQKLYHHRIAHAPA